MVDPRQPEQARSRRLAAIRQLVVDYGLSAVELSLDLGLVYPQVFDGTFYTAVAALQEELGFVCTAHLPFLWVDPSSLNEPVREASVDGLRRAIALVQPLAVETYVLHLWGPTTVQVARLLGGAPQGQAIVAGLMRRAAHSLVQVCELVDPGDLCVENLEAPAFEAVLPLIEQQGASICLDVGHLVHQGGGELEFWARHGARIREVHLHDAASTSSAGRRLVRDHLPLGQGQVDFSTLLHALQEGGYDGTVIVENNTKEDLEESLRQIQVTLARD